MWILGTLYDARFGFGIVQTDNVKIEDLLHRLNNADSAGSHGEDLLHRLTLPDERRKLQKRICSHGQRHSGESCEWFE